MSKLGAGAQVPGIEMADLNDGDIISATRKTTEDGGVTIGFSYTLPSGQELKSVPVLAENVGKAIFGWLDAVKGAIVEEATPAVDTTAQEERLRAQRARDWATDGVQVSGRTATDHDLAAAGLSIPQGGAPRREDYLGAGARAGDAPLPSDAKGYTRAKLVEARATVEMLEKQIKQRQAALKIAQKSVVEWTIAAKALRGKIR